MKPKKIARVALVLEDKGPAPRHQDIFAKRGRDSLLFFGGFLVLTVLSATLADFNFLEALESFPRALSWLGSNFVPDASALEYIPSILQKLLETVLISIAATVIASVIAFFLAILVARSTRPNKTVALVVRGFATVFRTIPLAAWAMIFLLSFGQSPVTGLLAILAETLGFLVRAFSETIDETSGSSVEALKASGATWGHTMAQSVIPSAMPQFVSWMLYMIETNIRSATLVGLLTGTGIGFAFNLYYKSLRYPPAALVVLAIVVVVLIIERISNSVRRQIL